MGDLTNILILSAIVYGIVNYIKALVLQVYPGVNGKLFTLVQFVAAAVVSAISQENILTSVTSSDIVGIFLTAMMAGGGSQLLYSIQKRLTTPSIGTITGDIIELDDPEPPQAATPLRPLEINAKEFLEGAGIDPELFTPISGGQK